MTIRDALRQGCSLLRHAEIETPYLDATVLLSEALGCGKEWLYARMPEALPAVELDRFLGYVELRGRGIPVSYIRQKKEFYGIEFLVDERVMVPRPATELLVDIALELISEAFALRSESGAIGLHDCCTGSGCIALTLKVQAPHLRISASDLSEAAGEVFGLNALRILSEVPPFILCDLLDGISGRFDLITANPPYLRRSTVRRMKDRGWPEPALALDGGSDGLDVAGRLVAQAPAHLAEGGRLLLEADPEQMPSLRVQMVGAGFDELRVVSDLAGNSRIITGRWTG